MLSRIDSNYDLYVNPFFLMGACVPALTCTVPENNESQREEEGSEACNLRENSQSKTFSFNGERTLTLPAHHYHHRHHHRRPEGGRTSHRLRRTEGATHRCCSARPPPHSGRRRRRAPTARSGTPYRPARPPGWPPRFDHWPSARRHTQHTHIKPHTNFCISSNKTFGFPVIPVT